MVELHLAMILIQLNVHILYAYRIVDTYVTGKIHFFSLPILLHILRVLQSEVYI